MLAVTLHIDTIYLFLKYKLETLKAASGITINKLLSWQKIVVRPSQC